jgi:predicted DNA-binding antitoxin AbrB/MazE fold protein
MNLSTAILDGVLKLVQRVTYKGKENRLRIYGTKSTVPEQVLYESKTNTGVFIDEVNDKMYKELNGKLVAL